MLAADVLILPSTFQHTQAPGSSLRGPSQEGRRPLGSLRAARRTVGHGTRPRRAAPRGEPAGVACPGPQAVSARGRNIELHGAACGAAAASRYYVTRTPSPPPQLSWQCAGSTPPYGRKLARR